MFRLLKQSEEAIHAIMFKTSSRIRKRMMADCATPGAPAPAVIGKKRSALEASIGLGEVGSGDDQDTALVVDLKEVGQTSGAEPPNCRRRLTFSDTDTIHELPTPELKEAERAAFQRAADAVSVDPTTSDSSWKALHEYLSDPILTDEYLSSQIRTALTHVFDLQSPGASARVHDAACTALALAAETFGTRARVRARASDATDRALCLAVLSCVARGGAAGLRLVGAAASAAIGFGWASAFRDELLRFRPRVLRCALDALDARDLSAGDWAGATRLVRVLGNADRNSEAVALCRLGSGSMSGLGPKTHVDTRVSCVREGDVRVMLRALERLGMEQSHAEAAEQALKALAAVARGDAEVAATIVMEQGAAVVREVARVHRSRRGLQAAVIDLLAMMASPDVFYHISLP